MTNETTLAPKLVYLRVTRTCNAKCPYCPSWTMPKEFPERAFLDRVVREIAETGAEEIRLTGGEVCLYEGLFDLIDNIAGLGISVSVITNGTIFHGRFLDRAKAAPIRHYLLSLDTPLAAKHNSIRVTPGLFETSINGIAAVRASNPAVTFAVNMVVSNSTVGDVEEAIEFAAKYGATKLNLIPIKDWPSMQPSREQMLRHNELRESLVTLATRRMVNVRPADMNLFGLTDSELNSSVKGVYPGRGHCFVPYQEAFVDAITGLVWPCDSTPYEGRKSASCGDLNEQTFGQIWNGTRYNKLRRAFATADPVPCSTKCDPSNGCKSELYAPLVKLTHELSESRLSGGQ